MRMAVGLEGGLGLDGDRCMGDTPTSSSLYLPMACCLLEVQETLNLFFKKKFGGYESFLWGH